MSEKRCGYCHLTWKESERYRGCCFHCGAQGPEEAKSFERVRMTSREPYFYDKWIVYNTWYDDFESVMLYTFWQGRECVGRVTITREQMRKWMTENPACETMPLVIDEWKRQEAAA